jgi:mono/diheme cytochrome c family protein
MEAYPPETLPEEQLAAVVEHLMALRGDPAQPADPALAERGRQLWASELECNTCHETVAGVAGAAPNFAGRGQKTWIARVIEDSSAPDLYGDVAEMPKFRDELAPAQIEQLADLLHAQGIAAPPGPSASAENAQAE